MQMVNYGQAPGTYASRTYTPSYLRTASPITQASGGSAMDQINRMMESLTGGQSAETPPEQKRGGLFGLLKKAAIGIALYLVAKKVLGALKKNNAPKEGEGLDLEA